MRDNPKPFEVYRHFKGNSYQILNIAKDSEDGHSIVVYQALYEPYDIYARDLQQFLSPVDRDKYPDAAASYRFTKVETALDTAKKAPEPVESEMQSTEYQLDPQVEAFLDADTYEEKLNILAALHRRITDEMLQIMSLTMDIELNPGSTEEKYEELKNCLLTRDKFEVERRF